MRLKGSRRHRRPVWKTLLTGDGRPDVSWRRSCRRVSGGDLRQIGQEFPAWEEGVRLLACLVPFGCPSPSPSKLRDDAPAAWGDRLCLDGKLGSKSHLILACRFQLSGDYERLPGDRMVTAASPPPRHGGEGVWVPRWSAMKSTRIPGIGFARDQAAIWRHDRQEELPRAVPLGGRTGGVASGDSRWAESPAAA